MNTPIVSIIIPTYNRATLICETLDSVKAQSYENWECIVVDDGSTDLTIERAAEYSKIDSRIKLFKRNTGPKGANTCRNIGLKNALGRYIIFLDSDDLLNKNCLEKRVRFANEHKDYNFYVFGVAAFKKSIKNLKRIYPSPPKSKEENLKLFLQYENTWNIVAVLWQKAFLLKTTGFNETFKRYQDIELHIRVLHSNAEFIISHDFEPDAYYRLGEESVEKWSNKKFLNRVAKESIRLFYFKHNHFSTEYKNSIHLGYLKFLKNYFLKKSIEKRLERLFLNQGVKYGYINRSFIMLYFFIKTMRRFNLHNIKYTGYYRLEAKLFYQ